MKYTNHDHKTVFKKSRILGLILLLPIVIIFATYILNKEDKQTVEEYNDEIEYIIVDENEPKKETLSEMKQIVKENAIQKEAPVVTVKEVKRQDMSTKTPIVSSGSEEKYFTIQVFSFKKEENAQGALKNLKEKGLDAFILTRNTSDGTTWHKVRIGKFDKKQEALNILGEVRSEYKESFILEYKASNDINE